MKMKSLIAIAVSSLMAASFAFAVPSANDNNQQQQAPVSENVGVVPPSDMANAKQSDLGNSNDDMSADTATGDDDY